MRIIKSNRNYKLNEAFPFIAEFEWNGLDEGLTFLQLCHIFEKRYGPSSSWTGPWGSTTYNNNWRREQNSKQRRKRIYYREPKDMTWAMMQLQ